MMNKRLDYINLYKYIQCFVLFIVAHAYFIQYITLVAIFHISNCLLLKYFDCIQECIQEMEISVQGHI